VRKRNLWRIKLRKPWAKWVHSLRMHFRRLRIPLEEVLPRINNWKQKKRKVRTHSHIRNKIWRHRLKLLHLKLQLSNILNSFKISLFKISYMRVLHQLDVLSQTFSLKKKLLKRLFFITLFTCSLRPLNTMLNREIMGKPMNMVLKLKIPLIWNQVLV